ncbi:MAG: DUF169 domain-containing protein [Candidatus Woesearchaeota archaeon]
MNYKQLSEKFTTTIKGKASPIGIKLFTSRKDAEKLKIVPLEEQLALCQAMKLAAVYEKSRLVFFENVDACVVGSYILGFGLPPEDIKDRWVAGFNYKPEIFEKLTSAIEAIPQKKYEAAIIAPLYEFERIKQKPEAVVIFINSAQAYLLLVGYFDAIGKKPYSTFNGHAACEVIAAVANGKSPWLTIPCGGARSIADAQDDELWLGMKPEELEAAIKRLESVGSKYPAPLNQMLITPMNPKHPLTSLISRKLQQ